MALYLYLQFPALQLDNLTPAAASNLPVAVVDNQHRIVQCNALAHKHGIKLNMLLGNAAALCHNLQLVPYQAALQLDLLNSVAQQLYQHSADIALDPPHGLYLRLCNMLSLYQGLAGYWQGLTSELNQLPYSYYYATATTPLAAKCLARQQLNLLTDKPDIIAAALQRSAVKFTDINQDVQQQLQRLGIESLGQLLALSVAELTRRFDNDFIRYIGRLRGDFFHALQYIEPRPGFSRYIELLYDISDTAILSKPLTILLQQLEHQLTRANALCHQLKLTILLRESSQLQFDIGSAQGEYRAGNWLKLIQLKLETVRLPAPAAGLKLEVSAFAPQQSGSDDLFQPRQGALSAPQLVSVLQARLGGAAVSGLVIQNQHQPELASARAEPLQCQPANITALALRPAFLLTNALPLTEAVEISSGPERICPDSWQLSSQRDYFIARSKQGQWLWLYRTLEQRWFIQGLFS